MEKLRFNQGQDVLSGSHPIVRSDLMDVLLHGLDNVVHFGKQFVRYGLIDFKVRAIFKDGSIASGDILVGADGTGSKVRNQFLPQASVRDIGLVGMAGRRPITSEMISYIPEHLLLLLTSILASNGLYMIVTQSIHRQNYASKASDDDELDSNPADHLIWVLVSPSAAYGSNPRALFHDGFALQQLALRLMVKWHPVLQKMVRETEPTTISATRLRASDPIPQWKTTNITLLGDAVHTMPPLRGLGRSTALRDAELLCKTLQNIESGNKQFLPAIREYEKTMLGYGFAAVYTSMQMVEMIQRRSNI
jgi:2-polyprenyl-6-methoxyphenol hydroxylase-like FAD-dependent oxidoreductase